MSYPHTQAAGNTRIAAFCAVLLALTMTSLDQAIVYTILPSLVADIGGFEQFAWVATGYGITFSVTTLLGGRLGDQFGHKKVFLVSVIFFSVASALCGISPNMEFLIIARLVQGLAGGPIVVASFSLIAQLFTREQQPKFQSYTSIVFLASSVLGPVIGGGLVGLVGWRWVFLVNLPLGVLAAIVVWTWVRSTAPERKAVIDYSGAICLSILAVAASLLIYWIGPTSPSMVWVLATALVLCGAFLAWILSARRAQQPLIPLTLISSPIIGLANLVNFISGFAVLGTVTFLALYLQGAVGTSPFMAGLLLVPMMFALVGTSVLVGRRASRTQRLSWYPFLSCVTCMVATLFLSRLDETSSYIAFLLASMLLGVGSGLAMQLFVVIVQKSAPPELIGAATATVTFSRFIGSALGIAALGALSNKEFQNALRQSVAREEDRLFLSSVDAFSASQLPEQLQPLFAASYAHGISTAMEAASLSLVLASFLATALGLAIRREIEDSESTEDAK